MISIVVCSIDPGKFARLSAHFREIMAAEPYEIVGIHDARSLCEGYNRGLDKSRGDIVIFCHDDVEIWTPDFAPRLKKHLRAFDAIGVAGTNLAVGGGWFDAGPPFVFGQVAHMNGPNFHIAIYGLGRRVVPGIQAMDGLLLAFHRPVIERVRWDADTFTGFHVYDMDCTYRAHRMGYRLGVALDLPVFHASHGKLDDAWRNAAELFMKKHAATLAAVKPRLFRYAAIEVETRELAIEYMTRIYEALGD